MASAFIPMGAVGAYTGFRIRKGKGGETSAITLGKTMREFHPQIMIALTIIFLSGAQGGLVLLSTQGKDILQSNHSVTAFLSLSLLFTQVSNLLSFDHIISWYNCS
jgi:hypothetical protein